ncbi:MAG: ligand-binding sensor domain-containing protein, partial [Chitinophagaceae bacterium]
MKYLRLLFLIFLQLLSHSSISQNLQLRFTHLSTLDGLSQSNVSCVIQDRHGFMWMGTRDGLDKYDGYQFTVYKNIPKDSGSLSNNFISSLALDADGNLWVGTFGGGLDEFNREKNRFIRFNHHRDQPGSLSGNFVNDVLIDSKGHLWVGTDGGGLDEWDPGKKDFIRYANHPGDSTSISGDDVSFIYEDRKHQIWACTYNGLNRLNPQTHLFTQFLHHQKDTSSLSSNSLLCMYEDQQGRYWVGTRGAGLDEFDGSTPIFRHFIANPNQPDGLLKNVILCLQGDAHDNIWIGTENGGLSILNPHTGVFQNFLHDDVDRSSLSNNSVYCVYKDTRGNRWLGTYSGGVNLLDKEASKFVQYVHTSSPNSLSNNNVLCLSEDPQGRIWAGTDGGGLNLLDPKTGKFTHFMHEVNNKNSLSGNYILDVAPDLHQNIWVGSWGNGLTLFNTQNNTFRRFKHDPKDPGSLSGDNVYFLALDHQSHLWVGTYGAGLDLYHPSTGKFTIFRHDPANPASLSSDRVNSLVVNNKDNVWVGTIDGGLNYFHPKTSTFTHYQHQDHQNSLSSNNVNCLFMDPQGIIWIGTNVGLDRFNPTTGHFKLYTKADGLPNNVVVGILEDHNHNFWLSTDKGLCRFNPITHVTERFYVSDGLQSNEFKSHSCLESSRGEMYFGGVNGFNAFFPDSIRENNYDPPLVITGFQIFNKEVPIAQGPRDPSPLKEDIEDTHEIDLNYKQSFFSFSFASLNYTNPNKRKYAYRLVGFDNSWNEVGSQRQATYTNLDPGDYTFEVRDKKNNGDWSSKIVSIKIIITPPFWGTWWFRILGILLAISGLILFFRSRIRVVERQNKILELKVQERTEALVRSTEEERLARMDAEKARQEAEKANQAKSIFLATMSHEIRTPMNGVIGMASLLSETSLSEEQQEYAEVIRNCGESLLNVINDILDFSKIESGKLELDLESFDLRSCVEGVLDVFAGKASQIGLDLVYQIDYNVPSQVIGDELRLRQILLNLVGNAMKFTRSGEIFVGVHLHQKEVEDSLTLDFEVRDSGIGIPEDKIHRLFKAFSQVDSSTTRKYGGTGLGLAICVRLVELMGGQIEVESEYGKGATFKFFVRMR